MRSKELTTEEKRMIEGMKVLRPKEGTQSKIVKNWKQIQSEAERLRVFIQKGEFGGKYTTAFCLAHAEVSESPMNFFVINEEVQDGILQKAFGSWCIINPKILAFSDPVYWKEGCMGFTHREPKNTDRMNKVMAEYYIPFLWTWRKVRKELKELPAFVIQHSIEHCWGRNIYFRGKEERKKEGPFKKMLLKPAATILDTQIIELPKYIVEEGKVDKFAKQNGILAPYVLVDAHVDDTLEEILESIVVTANEKKEESKDLK